MKLGARQCGEGEKGWLLSTSRFPCPAAVPYSRAPFMTSATHQLLTLLAGDRFLPLDELSARLAPLPPLEPEASVQALKTHGALEATPYPLCLDRQGGERFGVSSSTSRTSLMIDSAPSHCKWR